MTLQDTIQTLPNQYGVDVMIGLSPNAAQSLLIAESELGQVTPEKLEQSIKQFESELSQQTDPKVIKDLQKKLENLKKVADRPQKTLDMTWERFEEICFDKVEEERDNWY